VLTAVRDDIRQTLRIGWTEPALEALFEHPAFFTAGWSAVRPNVGRTFVSLAKSMRDDAASTVRSLVASAHLRDRVRPHLSDEELRRVEEVARAAHLGMPKIQVVVHALYRAARRERIPGTGREEPPIRRGVPDWQRWMSTDPLPEAARSALDEATQTLALPPLSTPLRLFARWPQALSSLCDALRSPAFQDKWKVGVRRLRRLAVGGIRNLPHPIDLQWSVLGERGLSEPERLQIVEVLAAHDASMATRTMVAAFAWHALGAPQMGLEG